MRPAVLALALIIVGCASRQPTGSISSPEADRERLRGLSSIQIDYVRGSNHHRFVATASPDSALVELFSETKLLRQGKIDRGKFEELAKQAQVLVASNVQQSVATCRTPFVLKLTHDEDTKKVEGCRSAEEGAAVGKLIREAEFLVHSKE